MKKNYQKPELDFSVFESEDEISSRGDWEINISRGAIDPYGADDVVVESRNFGEGWGLRGGVTATSNFGSNFGWSI